MTKSFGHTTFKRRGKWAARIRFIDDSGKQVECYKAARTRSEAQDLERRMVTDLDELGTVEFLSRWQGRSGRGEAPDVAAPPIDAGPRAKTFGDLASEYSKNYVRAPMEHDGHVYAGMWSADSVKRRIDVLLTELGADLPLSDLTFDCVRDLKIKRLETPVKHKGWKESRQRSVADVHRLLGTLRTMIVYANRLRWMSENPFRSPVSGRDQLISPAKERQRERVLSPTEERALLNVLAQKQFQRSRDVVIFLIDTGARIGELVPQDKNEKTRLRAPARKATKIVVDTRPRLRWRDLDFDAGLIDLPNLKASTSTVRRVGMTPRLRRTLDARRLASNPAPDDEVFTPLTYFDVWRDFEAATKTATITDIRIHDLRHSRATRWIQGGLSESEVAHLLGHSKKSNVTRRYVNPDERTIERALQADARFKKAHPAKAESGSIN